MTYSIEGKSYECATKAEVLKIALNEYRKKADSTQTLKEGITFTMDSAASEDAKYAPVCEGIWVYMFASDSDYETDILQLARLIDIHKVDTEENVTEILDWLDEQLKVCNSVLEIWNQSGDSYKVNSSFVYEITDKFVGPWATATQLEEAHTLMSDIAGEGMDFGIETSDIRKIWELYVGLAAYAVAYSVKEESLSAVFSITDADDKHLLLSLISNNDITNSMISHDIFCIRCRWIYLVLSEMIKNNKDWSDMVIGFINSQMED